MNKTNKFKFGKNWKLFLKGLESKQIQISKKALLKFKQNINLENRSFIDIGSGSGLSSLIAKQLGAKVTSIDVDIECIECTKFLKNKFYKDSKDWDIKKLSILNTKNIKKMNKFDYVYSWGVLHHTGNLKKALKNTESLCRKNGFIHLALYNDQGKKSKRWKMIKKIYIKNNFIVKKLIELIFSPFFLLRPFLKNHKIRKRGMTNYIDMVDWLGGYPFEPSKPEEIFNFFINKNYTLVNLYTCGPGHGCNEFLFKKN
ncbi:class I SAM-dependent methyltransferase [Candidatus Pelagibacter sp.]|nr:class I SAM-dependent methyltransferase [Candidatus Pelagibacter sp.]